MSGFEVPKNPEPYPLHIEAVPAPQSNGIGYIANLALRASLAIGLGLSAGVVFAAVENEPQTAYAVTDSYPDKDLPCAHVGDPQFGQTSGSNYWCDNYDWGVITRNANGAVTGTSVTSSRGYGYRNCTDWAAWRVKELTGVEIAHDLHDSHNWDDNALSHGYTVDNSPEVGDIAVWEKPPAGGYGHVAVVEAVNSNGTVNISEYNKGQNGTFGTRNNVSGVDHFIDVNGPNAPTPPPQTQDPLSLSFVRLNAPGGAQVVSYSESSNFTAMTENATSGYPSTTPDGMVVPLFQPDGDLSFVRLNHSSGQVEVVTYGEGSGYQNMVDYELTGYPATTDGQVIPMYQPDGDLSFIRMNQPGTSNNVEVVAYSEASGYKAMTEHEYTGYPGVPNDGAVVPQYWLNGDLVMLRLNHPSHNMELTSYSHSSGYHNLVNYALLGYPSVPTDGSVVPLIQPNDGDLSFVNSNRAPANTEDMTYSVGSNFQTMNNYAVTGYPSVNPAERAVFVRYSQ